MKKNQVEKKLQIQVEKYKKVEPRYQKLACLYEELLQEVIKKYAPQGIVQVRAKSISSFAEKIQRKGKDLKNPVNEFTDLCGGRVITNTPSEVKAICKFIEDNFEIDWDNSIDISQRHKPAEFGYRSVHYIVSFKKSVFPSKDVNVSIPKNIFPNKNYPMKAEIQVRTLLEHAWAVFAHDRTYKSSFKIPYKWQRELAAVAAILEDADMAFERIQSGLKTYASSYSAYMTEEQIREEIDNLGFVLSLEPNNKELAAKIGKLSISIGCWQKVINILARFVDSEYQPALKALGIAMYKYYRSAPKSRGYKQGQKYLEHAIELDKNDADAIASLAGSWKGIDDDKAGEFYRQAFEVDPSDPYPLENYLTYEIVKKKDTSIASVMAPVIHSSIKRCREQVEVGVNIPWAYYSMGMFYLLLKNPYECLSAYAKAIQFSTAGFMVDTSLESLNKLSVVEKDLPGYEWVKRLLFISRAARLPAEDASKEMRCLTTTGYDKIQGPVVIVAGGCDPVVEKIMWGYKDILLEAFRVFRGTIISGGTRQGISGLVGGLRKKYSAAIYTIGYLPKMVPADATVDKDPLRYKEIRYTEGNGFTPLEPLQNWIDLIYSGIHPSRVKILGINGGRIASIEYRIALALGAKVALIEESGREASKLLADADWMRSEGLIPMPVDSRTVRAFIGCAQPKLEPEKRDAIAREFHELYRGIRKNKVLHKEPSLADWHNLKKEFKESNLHEADHIFEKLHQIGCEAYDVKGRKISLIEFGKKEIELMAEMEHGRWNAERLNSGWRWGETRDDDKKINPYIVGWQSLPEDIKEWDREMVRKIPVILEKVGLEIRRVKRR